MWAGFKEFFLNGERRARDSRGFSPLSWEGAGGKRGFSPWKKRGRERVREGHRERRGHDA